MLRKIVKEKINSTEKSSDDLLDQAIEDMDKKKFLSEEFHVKMLFAILFASFESSVTLSLTLKLIAEHPAVLQELTVRNCTRILFLAHNLCIRYM